MQKEKKKQVGQIRCVVKSKLAVEATEHTRPIRLPVLPFSSSLPSAHLFLSFLLFSPCQVGRLEPSGPRPWKIQPREEAAMCLAEPHEVSRGASVMELQELGAPRKKGWKRCRECVRNFGDRRMGSQISDSTSKWMPPVV